MSCCTDAARSGCNSCGLSQGATVSTTVPKEVTQNEGRTKLIAQSDINGLPMSRNDFRTFNLHYAGTQKPTLLVFGNFSYVFARKPSLPYICYTSTATQPVVRRREAHLLSYGRKRQEQMRIHRYILSTLLHTGCNNNLRDVSLQCSCMCLLLFTLLLNVRH